MYLLYVYTYIDTYINIIYIIFMYIYNLYVYICIYKLQPRILQVIQYATFPLIQCILHLCQLWRCIILWPLTCIASHTAWVACIWISSRKGRGWLQKRQWSRVLWAPFLHADEAHLYYNMASLLWKVTYAPTCRAVFVRACLDPQMRTDIGLIMI